MIREICNLNAEINNAYRSSNLPKSIRKYLAENRRKKLVRTAEKYSNKKIYDVGDFYDVFSYLDTTFHMEDFAYISNIRQKDDHKFIDYLGSLTNSEGGFKYVYNVSTNSRRRTIDIIINTTTERGKKTFKLDDRVDTKSELTDNDITKDLLEGLNILMSESIKAITDDIFERSRRIYEV